MSDCPIVTRLSDVEPEAVSWLWPRRLAEGKLTLLVGEPGVGKSLVTLDCAARLTRGALWPDGTEAPVGNVLLLAAEDGLSDTIRPRFDALDGDPARLSVLEAVARGDGTCRVPSLDRDLRSLADALTSVRPALVIIDPLTAYLGNTDAHRDADVRGVLAPLIALIDEHHCALLAVMHLTKDSQRAPLHRPSGSIAFVASARVVLAAASDPHDPGRRVLASLKSNLSTPPASLAYRLNDGRLSWTGPVELSADQLLRPASPEDRDRVTDAEQVIRELLADPEAWPLPASAALEAGRACGVAERTMQVAAKRLGIRVRRVGFGRGGQWVWHRPTDDIDAYPQPASPAHREPAPMASMQNPEQTLTKQNIDAMKTPFPRAREVPRAPREARPEVDDADVI